MKSRSRSEGIFITKSLCHPYSLGSTSFRLYRSRLRVIYKILFISFLYLIYFLCCCCCCYLHSYWEEWIGRTGAHRQQAFWPRRFGLSTFSGMLTTSNQLYKPWYKLYQFLLAPFDKHCSPWSTWGGSEIIIKHPHYPNQSYLLKLSLYRANTAQLVAKNTLYCSVLPCTSPIPTPNPLYTPTGPACFWYFWFSFTGWFPVVRVTPSACGWLHRLRLLESFNFVCLATSVSKKLQLMKTHLITVLPRRLAHKVIFLQLINTA